MKIKLNNKSHEISFTFYALKVFKQETGISILKGGLETAELDEGVIAELAYAGLKGADRNMKLSLEDVSFHLELSAMKTIIEQLGSDMSKLAGEDKAGKK